MENRRYVIRAPFLVMDLKPLHEDVRHRMGGRELPKTPKGAAFMALKRNISRATQFSLLTEKSADYHLDVHLNNKGGRRNCVKQVSHCDWGDRGTKNLSLPNL